MVYFDHNATTPLLPAARQGWLEAAEQFIGNPSSPHRLGARAEAALMEAREELAILLGCDPLQIVWTSGATESNNTVLHHWLRSWPRDSEVWISAIEHPCVMEPARHYFGTRCQLIPVTSDGVVELDWLRSNLKRSRPAGVAVMAANNETGVLQPWPEVLALCREREVPLLCDAAQWIGKLPARGLEECDFVTGCAHKFGGPKGVGFMKVPPSERLTPLLRGGPQEEGRRAGTENVAAVLSMMAALKQREKLIAENGHTERAVMRDAFEKRLAAELPDCRVLGRGVPRLWNTVMALLPAGAGKQRWVVKLDKLGFAVSTGSACASGKEEPSHVLAAMSCAPARGREALRFSSGWETTGQEWEALSAALLGAWQTLKK